MSIIKSPSLNPILRFCLRTWNSIDAVIRGKLLGKIRFSGVASLKLDDLKFKMYSNCDDTIVDRLYFDQSKYAEITEIKLFKAFAKQSSVIFDVGANTGLYSVVSRGINPNAKIYAFEPYLINAHRFKKNMQLNNIEDVNLLEKAVGNSKDDIEFAVPAHDQICDVLSADTEFTNRFYKKWGSYKNVMVPQITIDTFMTSENLNGIDLIKIDVENYESFVLEGALETLDKFSPTIFIEIFVDTEKIKFYEENLKPLGYHCYSLLNEGIIRTESLVANPDCWNFILSKARTQDEYLSFSELDNLVEQLT